MNIKKTLWEKEKILFTSISLVAFSAFSAMFSNNFFICDV